MKPVPWSMKTVGSVSVATPVLVVSLVLLVGATLFLRSQRYIRRTTAYVLVAAGIVGIALVELLSYTSGM